MPHDIRPNSAASEITSETIEVLHNRVSIRKYSDEPVTEAHVEAILKAAFRAPTSSNIQAYSVIVVRDPATKAKLAELTGNQRHVAECPVYLQFCADLTRMEAAMKRHGHDLENNNLEYGLVASIDAALVGMAAQLVADSIGIKGLMIGAVRNHPDEVGKLLGMPRRVYPVFGMCLGWPAEAPKQKPRMDLGLTVHYEKYDTEGLDAKLDGYDSELAKHYDSVGKETTRDSWTYDIDAKFAQPRRDKLREQLKGMGFDFR
jgi:FMN reductase (NADPH)